MAKKKLPVYELTVTDINEPGKAVDFTAFVDEPAIESYWMKFKREEQPEEEPKVFQMEFSVANEERRIITGPAMIPDMKIYRRDNNGEEYYVFFSAETIDTIVKKWAKGNHYNDVNLMHDSKQAHPDGVTLYETFIVDSRRGIKAPSVLPETLPDGTWIQSYFIESDELWQEIKAGKYRGFSVEGMFQFLSQKPKNEGANDIERWLSSMASHL